MSKFKTQSTETASKYFNFHYGFLSTRLNPSKEDIKRGELMRKRELIQDARELGKWLTEPWEE